MNAESSISKSAMSSASQSMDNLQRRKSRLHLLDLVFPVFDQTMISCKFPSWFTNLTELFMSFQMLAITFWIYGDHFDNMNPTWRIIYSYFFKIVYFSDPRELGSDHLIFTLVLFGICFTALNWLTFVVGYDMIYLKTPVPFLYICAIFLDTLLPLVCAPAVFCAAHGIYNMENNYSKKFLIQTILGIFCWLSSSLFIFISYVLKTRQIILIKLTYQLFDGVPFTVFFMACTSILVFSAVLRYFAGWYLVGLIIVHGLLCSFMAYRIFYLPFYTLYKNALFFASAVVGVLMDAYIIIIYLAKLPFDYTVIVFGILIVVLFIACDFWFKKRIEVIKKDLTATNENIDLNEFFSSLDLGYHALKTQSYLVVGLASVCDYMADGSLLDYLVNNGEGEQIWCQTLQILTFFPCESNKMNILFKKILNKRSLTYNDRYLVYAVTKVKTQRLVSNSKDTLDAFNKLRILNEQSKATMKSFWDKASCQSGFLTKFNGIIEKTKRTFDFTLTNNPNNLRIINEYVDFLIEVCGDFDKAIIQNIKGEMIQDGKNFNIDQSYRSLIGYFPKYLKNQLFDTKGRRVKKINNDELKTSSHGSSESMRLTDVEMEEFVESNIIKGSRVRLAFYRSIKDQRPRHATLILDFALICFVVIIAAFVGFYVCTKLTLSWRKNGTYDIGNMAKSSFYSHFSMFFGLLKWSVLTGRFNNDWTALGDLSTDNKYGIEVIPKRFNYIQKMYYSLNQSRILLNSVLNSLALIGQGDSAYEAGPELIKEVTKLNVCSGGKKVNEFNASLADLLVFLAFDYNWIAGDLNLGHYNQNIFKDDFFCQATLNVDSVTEYSFEALKSLLNFGLDLSQDYSKILLIWMIAGCICISLAAILPVFLVIASYKKMVNKTMKMLLNLNNSIKEQAKIPLRIDNLNNNDSLTAQIDRSNDTAPSIVPLVNFIIVIGIVLMYAFECNTAIKLNDSTSMFTKWFYISAQRMVSINEITSNCVQLVLLGNKSLTQDIIDIEEMEEITEEYIHVLQQLTSVLVNGNGTISSSLGYDSVLDAYEIQDSCSLGYDPKTVHDMYACTSLSRQLIMFESIVDNILKNHQSYNGSLNKEYPLNLLHILEFHIFPNILRVSDRITELVENSFDENMLTLLILTVLGCALAFVNFLLSLSYRNQMITTYRLLLVLFQRLPPEIIINNKEVLDFFTRKNKSDGEDKMSVAKSIVYKAKECIVITNENAIVEIVNQSYTDNTGIQPDQMLGQDILNFIAMEDNDKINQQIQLMLSGQGSLFWQDHVKLVNDNNRLIPFNVQMIGMKDKENSTKVESIVFILTNEEDDIKKAKDAEIAKAKSEKLLYQILPKDIVVRLNRGETDISFVIPRCSIFFIDIVKFSQYSSLLTPSDIMANLSMVFATFDKIMAEYSSITKIKLIGDVYMAAAGLFQDPEDTSNKHAEDAVKACIAVQRSLDDINTRLNSSLEVRIGINSGGPLIGGVLGTDKPTFDIIGDPINIAARLQSTDIPGKIHISEKTKELIQELDFEIETRGPVFLKGKGQMMTYFVWDRQHNSSIEILYSKDAFEA